jgi:hypothetical protein
MNHDKPDFYMTSTESNVLKPIRQCFAIKRFTAQDRDDYLLIRIRPPIQAGEYKGVTQQVSQLVVATRHKGVSLFPATKWPVRVYVLRVLIDAPEQHDILRDNELELLDWADLYKSSETAKSAGASYLGNPE